jgi:hypothetical protein
MTDWQQGGAQCYDILSISKEGFCACVCKASF